MAREDVILSVDARGLESRDPLSRAATRSREIREEAESAKASLERHKRHRHALLTAERMLFGKRHRPEKPIMAELVRRSPYEELGLSESFLRRGGIFPGEGFDPSRTEPVRTTGGGGGGGGGTAGPRRRRGPRGARRPSGFRDPLQLGQIFGGGPVSAGLGLRAGGLATMGVAGAGFLALDAALRKVIQTIQTLNRLYQSQVRLLQPFSASLTGAAAQRNIMMMQNRFRLAQESGAQLARVYREETEFRIAVENFMNGLTTSLTPVLELIFRMATAVLEFVSDFGELRLILMALTKAVEPWIPGLSLLIDRLLEWLEQEQGKDPTLDALMADQLAFFAEPAVSFSGTNRRRPPGL